jgi:hypothetical protein
VSRLTWTERNHGWRAGPYEIELAAPHLWVCTRRARGERVVVEATSGSLSALKTRIDGLEFRRSSVRRSVGYLAAFLLSMTIVGFAAAASLPVGPMLVFLFSTVGLWAAIKSLDCVVRRSWEALNLNYQ